MKDMESFLHKLEESLDVMDKNIDDLFAQAHEQAHEKDLEKSLRNQHALVGEKARKLRSAVEKADEDAEQAHEEARSVWQDLKRAFATARSRLGD